VLWHIGFGSCVLVRECSIPSTPLAQSPITIFGNAVPTNPAAAGTRAVTLGVKFGSAQPGTVSGIRFCRKHAKSNGYSVRLYTAEGSLLAEAIAPPDTCSSPGWGQVNFAAPVWISANTTDPIQNCTVSARL
jgi:hypothetical protein